MPITHDRSSSGRGGRKKGTRFKSLRAYRDSSGRFRDFHDAHQAADTTGRDLPRQRVEASLLRRVEKTLRDSLSGMSALDLYRAMEAPTPAATVAQIISAAPDVGLPTESAWTRALARGAARKQDLIARAGGCFSSGQVADLLGISVSAVNQRKNKHKSIFAVPLSGGEWGFPVRQFVDGDVRRGVADVVRAAADMNPWVLLSILLDDAGEDGGPAVLDRLDNEPVRADVLQRVRSYGEHVAA